MGWDVRLCVFCILNGGSNLQLFVFYQETDQRITNKLSSIPLLINFSLVDFPESLAQEIELERKARQQTGERDVKSPLQDRPNYYKNSVLFSSAT